MRKLLLLLSGKIKESKSPMQLLRHLIVCLCRFDGRIKLANFYFLVAMANLCGPFFGVISKMNSLKTRGISSSFTLISTILSEGAWSKIFFTIIQSVSVFMVNLLTFFFYEKSVHHYSNWLAINTCATKWIKTFRMWIPINSPIPLVEEFKVLSIYNGIFALRKWNQAIGCIRRLSNRMPLKSAFWHSPTPVGLCFSAVIVTLFLFPSTSFAQGSNYQSVVLGSTGKPVGGALITVCASGATPGIPCSPTTNIFQDQALTIPAANPIITDAYGNFGFWAAPGTYLYSITGSTVTPRGPYTIVLPCIVGASCASAGGLPSTAVTFSATPSFAASTNASYSMTLTGNITAITITGTPINGNLLRFQFSQDATGGRTVIWPGNFQIPTTFAFKSFPNQTNRMTFVYDGTNWQMLEDIPDGALDYSAVAFSATPTFSNSRSAAFDFTLTGNVTASTFTTSGRAGTQFTLNACENGTGGFTFAFPGNVSNPQGFTFDTVANHCNRILYVWNGTTWIGIGGGTGGGGGSPANPTNSLQKNASGAFGSTGLTETGTTLSIDDDTNTKGPNPYFDIMRYGGYFGSGTSPITTTGSITSGTPTLTLAAAQDFANGQGVVVNLAGLTPVGRNASFPSAATVGTVTPMGVTNGSTTRSYKYVFEDYFGGLTAAGTAGTTATAAATIGTNTVSLTGVVRDGNGTDTFTCSTNCNIAVNTQVQISGFVAASVNGTVVTVTNPTATTFTVNSNGLPAYTESASGTVSVRACNALLPSGSLSQESVILRTWIYRQDNGAGNYNLVGVSAGQDPFFVDCGQGVTAPAYVPTTAPAAAQAGYLATTISSGGGTTTLTLAANAGTTATTQTVQHDNSSALIAAWTAAYTAHGGVVRIPIIPGNTLLTFPFNALTNLAAISNPTQAAVKLQISVAGLNQPWILPGFSEFEGLPQTNTAFQYSPLGAVGGTAIPLFMTNATNTGGMKISGIKFTPTATGANSILFDQKINAGGTIGVQLIDNGYVGLNASAVIVKGGFDFWFTRGSCAVGGSETGLWLAHPCFDFTNSSSYIGATNTQVPGLVKVYDTRFTGGTAIQEDNLPAMNQFGVFTSGQFNAVIAGVLHENNAGPPVRIALCYSIGCAPGSGLDVSDVTMSDSTNGAHQPLVELTGNSAFSNITLRNNKGASGLQSAVLGGGTFASPICINNTTLAGCGQTPNVNSFGASTTVDGGQVGAINGGELGYFMPTPAAPLSCVVSAGGSVPVGTLTYAIAQTDRATFSTSPFAGLSLLGPSCTVTTTTGNQTVTVTRPALTTGAYGWAVWKNNAEAQMPSTCVTSIPATTTTYVDTSATACGPSPPGINTAFVSGVASTGINAPQFIGGGIGGSTTKKTANYTVTVNDFDVYGDPTGGAFTVTLPHLVSGSFWNIYNVTAGANLVTVQADSGTILTPTGAVSSVTLGKGVAETFNCDGTTCYLKGGNQSSGSGTINPCAQYGNPYYSAVGTGTTLSCVATNTVNGLYFLVHNVTGGTAVPPSEAFLGVPTNVQTTSYTLAASDRAGYVLFSSCTTPTLTLPAIAGSFASNMPFRVTNACSGNVTITANAANSIDGGALGGSVTLLPGWSAFLSQDNTPNWFSIRTPAFGAFTNGCTAITFNASTGLPCAALPVVSGVNSQTVNYTAVSGDNGKIVWMNGASVTLTLPASPPAQPWGIFIENANASSLTVSRNGLNIDGAASNLTLTQNQGVYLTTDGSNYFTSRGVGGGGGGGGTPCTVTGNSLQYNNGGAFGCVTEFTYASSTITASASGKIDLSAAPVASGLKIPTAAAAAPLTTGFIAVDSTKIEPVFGKNGLLALPVGVLAPGDYYQSEEWTGADCTGNLKGWNVGVGGCQDLGTPVAGHPGAIQLSTTTTINTITRYGLRGATNNGNIFPDIHTSIWYMNWTARLAEPACAGEACTIQVTYRLGLMNAWGAAPTSGYYFEVTEAATNTNNINCITNNSGTSTSNSSGTALDTNFHTFTIFNDGSGSSTKFYIDGTLVCTNTTNLPTTSPLFPDFQSTNTSANAKLSDFDFWNMWLAVTR